MQNQNYLSGNYQPNDSLEQYLLMAQLERLARDKSERSNGDRRIVIIDAVFTVRNKR